MQDEEKENPFFYHAYPLDHVFWIREKNVTWREAFKDKIKKHSEGGFVLKGCRFRDDVTQKELAEALTISQHHISEMENGKRPIGKEMAKRFAAFFKTDYRLFL